MPSTRPLVTGCRRPLISRCVPKVYLLKNGENVAKPWDFSGFICRFLYGSIMIYIYIDLYVDNHIWIYGFFGKKMK